MPTPSDATALFEKQWPLPFSATLGSAVRMEGIEREIRARLPWSVRRGVRVEAGRVALVLAADEPLREQAQTIVARVLEGAERLAILPREAEDILGITAHERHKWTKDGRLQSAGTRTVKLRGRARSVTFHVFDPQRVEDVLDRDLTALWREEDREAIVEKRRRAAAKGASARAAKRNAPSEASPASDANEPARSAKPTRPPDLDGWDAFAQDGLLR